jgi:hypothetical protein
LAIFSFSSILNTSLECLGVKGWLSNRLRIPEFAGAEPRSGARQIVKSSSNLDYSRPDPHVSSTRVARLSILRNKTSASLCIAAIVVSCAATAAFAQYPGKITKGDKPAPVLRSVAVLEWVGAPGKPSASRLVPVTVFDGEQLNDGTIYLTRPEPLALANGVEYELQTAGKPIGIFDVAGAGEINGTWEGFGKWKPLTAPEAAKASEAFNTSTLYGSKNDAGNDANHDAENDQPVLHRKHPKDSDDSSSGSASNAGSADSSAKSSSDTSSASKTSDGTTSSESSDPDRPTLHRKPGGDASSSSSTSGTSSGSSGAGSGNVDPDRPTLHRSPHAADDDTAGGSSNVAPDPDRPRLTRGRPAGLEDAEAPKLKGFPPSMQQAVAVSDASKRADHPWKYTWANMDDEYKMKTALEAIARTALGLDTPPAPPKPAPKTAAAKARAARAKKATPVEQPEPVELADEKFRVFELAYGSNATLVLTASTPLPDAPASTDSASAGNPSTDKAAPTEPDSDEPPPPVIKRGKPTSNTTTVKPAPATTKTPAKTATQTTAKPGPQKYVTLVAQPDLYGGIIVLFKSVTDAAHLDETPRMRLIDAVDAMADNRGELLFELRGKTQRQFALFRVMRGSAEQLFATAAIP